MRGKKAGGGGGGVPKPLLVKRRDLKFCWLKFAKNFEKFLRNLTALFDFLPTFFELAIKGKQKSFRYSLRATDMNIMT